MLAPLSSTSRVMKIGITSKTHDMKDLSMITYWTIRFRLMSIDGVANIPIWGRRAENLNVVADPDLMRLLHKLTLDELLAAAASASRPMPITTRRAPQLKKPWRATQAYTATCKPICVNA